MAEDDRVFGITGNRSTVALDPGVWNNTVCEGGYKFMVAWMREKGEASENRQGKKYTEEADKVEVATGVNVGCLRRFRAVLIGPTQGLPKRYRLRQYESQRTLKKRFCRCYAFVCTLDAR